MILRIEIPEEAVSNVYVHENLLCTASPVFKAALQGGFEETSTKTVTVREVDASTIDDFLYWLYHEKCKSTNDLVRYAKLNKLADMYDIAWLKYDAGLATLDSIQAFVDSSAREGFVPPFVNQVYANSAPDDTIRKVLVAIYVHTFRATFYETAENKQCLSGCLEFGSDVAIEMGRNLTGLASSYRSYTVKASIFPKPGDKLETEDIKPTVTPVVEPKWAPEWAPPAQPFKRRR